MSLGGRGGGEAEVGEVGGGEVGGGGGNGSAVSGEVGGDTLGNEDDDWVRCILPRLKDKDMWK